MQVLSLALTLIKDVLLGFVLPGKGTVAGGRRWEGILGAFRPTGGHHHHALTFALTLAFSRVQFAVSSVVGFIGAADGCLSKARKRRRQDQEKSRYFHCQSCCGYLVSMLSRKANGSVSAIVESIQNYGGTRK